MNAMNWALGLIIFNIILVVINSLNLRRLRKFNLQARAVLASINKEKTIPLSSETIIYLHDLAKRNNATFDETLAYAVSFGLTVLEERSER